MNVTVCIPSIAPRAEMLQRALASVLAQTQPATAMVVAFDTDRLGAAATRNQALFAARTEWVAFLDDDDELYPHHLERLCAHAEATGADVVFPWFDVDGGTDPFPMHEGREFDPADPHSFPITTLVRRSVAMAVGGFPVETDPHNTIGAGEDWLFWNEVAAAGAKIVHLPERTWLWRHHGANTAGLPSRW